MEEEEYELMPHHELDQLRREIEDLKHHPLGETPSGNELLRAVQELNQSVKALTTLFKIAAEQVGTGKTHEETEIHKFEPMTHKMNELIEQNKKLAAGIVSVADLLKEKTTETKPQPAQAQPPQQFAPQPQQFTPQQYAPQQFTPQPMAERDAGLPDLGMPPDFDAGLEDSLPPPDKKTKGLFK